MTTNLWMQKMFSSISSRYALLNRVLTFGRDNAWRQALIESIDAQKAARILDICTGTADLAIKISEKAPNIMVYALDYSSGMLAVARERARAQGRKNIIFKEEDCVNTGFDSDYFDYITVSFGFRNLSYSKENLNKALGEIYRILKLGGKFLILETNQPLNRFIRKLFHFYALRIVPLTGKLFSGKKEPYDYLSSSIVKFFNETELTSILTSCGFKKEKTVSFMFGAVLLWVTQK